ncbi:type II toxin-antitoxin system RelB/DinJ family antitoxin [Candidatus Saccharibacteria bacterium]|nr:type II toxin-antitoxin system RelB/DinJ family antitoxin [Candidatus Saccharibacteria bacterium]
MSKSVINFKVDTETKKQAQALAKELGVPLSTVVNAQLKQFLRSRSFSVNSTPEMSAELESILETIELDRKTGRNLSPAFITTEDMFTHLEK